MDFLETCLLQTDWVFLSVTPHCFRVEAASNTRVMVFPSMKLATLEGGLTKVKQ